MIPWLEVCADWGGPCLYKYYKDAAGLAVSALHCCRPPECLSLLRAIILASVVNVCDAMKIHIGAVRRYSMESRTSYDTLP